MLQRTVCHEEKGVYTSIRLIVIRVKIEMPRKNKNTSFEVRQLVIWHHTKQKSVREISRLLNVPKSTVGDIIKRFNNEDRIESVRQPGRPEKLTLRDKCLISRLIKANPKRSAAQLCAEVSSRTQTAVGVTTMRTALRELGYTSRVAMRKPFINERNRKKRLEFAQKYVVYPDHYWEDVLFTDESKYNLVGNDGRTRVWRKPHTALHQRNVTPTVKHGGGNIMVWGCVSAKGVGALTRINGIMNAPMYVRILRDHLLPSATKFGIRDSFKLYQDNDPNIALT
jgi:transposase